MIVVTTSLEKLDKIQKGGSLNSLVRRGVWQFTKRAKVTHNKVSTSFSNKLINPVHATPTHGHFLNLSIFKHSNRMTSLLIPECYFKHPNPTMQKTQEPT